jgi:exopolysaccharide biosynthesis polyprenyl glycosylphosphotransferase
MSLAARKPNVKTLLALDLAVILASYLTAYLVRFWFGLPFLPPESPGLAYLGYTLVFLPVWLLVIAAEGGYEEKYLLVGTEEYSRMFHAGALAALSTTLFVFLAQVNLSRGWALLSWGMATVMLIVVRYTYRHYLHRINRSSHPATTVLMVGSNTEAAEIADTIDSAKHLGARVLGALNGVGPTDSRIKVLGDVKDMKACVKSYQPSAVVIVPSALSGMSLSAYNAFRDVDCSVYIAPSLHDVMNSRLGIHSIGGMPLVKIERVRIEGLKGVAKRAFDLVLSVAFTVLLLPAFIAVAAAIKLESKGPVFFKQTRLGYEGVEFEIFKFRSMVDDAERQIKKIKKLNQAKGHIFKIKNDPRVTRVGAFLRRWSLDELPQLINVIKGEMSLVGPRPPIPSEVANYTERQRQRLGAKPGITGYWQVSSRENFDFDDMLKKDLFYIENWSPTFDMYILWRTIGAVWSGKGSY